MSVVVDASVLIAASVDSGRDGIWAEDVLAGGTPHGLGHIAVEATNILHRLERAKRITTLEAASAHHDYLRLEIELYPFAPCASGPCDTP